MNRLSMCKLLFLLLSILKVSAFRSLRTTSKLLIINHKTTLIPSKHSLITGNIIDSLPRKDLALNAVPTALFTSEWHLWSVLSIMSTLGIISEKTNIGSMLSSPIVTMVATLLLANLGLVPSSSPVYDVVMKKFVPLAIPLLLFDADLRKCIRVTGRLLRAFLVGSVGTIVGTLVAFLLVPMKNIVGGDKIASALCARHIGGAVNFVAVADILNISPDVVAAALAADNIVVALYFTLLFAVTVPDRVNNVNQKKARQERLLQASQASEVVPPSPAEEKCPMDLTSGAEASTAVPSTTETSACPVAVVGNIFTPMMPEPANEEAAKGNASSSVVIASPSRENVEDSNEVTLPTISSAISIALALYSISEIVGKLTGLSPLVAVSLLTVLTATVFPRTMGSASRAGGVVGVLIMQMFFAVTGASGHISTVLRFGPGVFLHTTVQVIVHFVVAIGLGRLLKLPFKEIALASNANVGGPTTAAAMASNKRWNALVLPALLTGVFGYAIATGLGVAMMKPLAFISRLRN